MTSIPPSLQVFWSGPLASSAAFVTLSDWSKVLQAPMPEAFQPPKPPSHISAAIRRLVDKPPTWRGADPVSDALSDFHDRRADTGRLLRSSVDAILVALERPEETGSLLDILSRSPAEIRTSLRSLDADLGRLRVGLSEAECAGRIPSAGADWMFEVAVRLYTRLARAEAQVRAVAGLMAERPTEHSFQEIRRRLSWILSLREFDRPFDWNAIPGAALERVDVTGPFDIGMILLLRFRPDASEREISLYEKAATSSVRGRDLAFAIDGVLADVFEGALGEEAYARQAGRYDATLEDAVHQYARIRLPCRGVQALLLGLWAAGNRLRVAADSEDRPEGHEAFFNDFPLLKVAFGFASPKEAGRTITRKDLRESRRYQDGHKRREAWKKHFETRDGRLFLEHLRGGSVSRDLSFLRETRLPFPDFPFDVLIDRPSPLWEQAASLGFGRRWLKPDEDGAALFHSLQDFLAAPTAGVSDLVLDWLDTWEMS